MSNLKLSSWKDSNKCTTNGLWINHIYKNKDSVLSAILRPITHVIGRKKSFINPDFLPFLACDCLIFKHIWILADITDYKTNLIGTFKNEMRHLKVWSTVSDLITYCKRATLSLPYKFERARITSRPAPGCHPFTTIG